jgi:N-acetylglutamate synthase-like GNAT family acetyltransferase
VRGPYSHHRAAFDEACVESLSTKGKFLLAQRDGGLAGCVYVAPAAGSSVLDLLAVNPRMRRSGIGTQLVLAAEGLCHSMKSPYVHITVASLSGEIVKFWRRRGYVEFDRLPCLCQPRSSLGFCMVKMAKQLEGNHLYF